MLVVHCCVCALLLYHLNCIKALEPHSVCHPVSCFLMLLAVELGGICRFLRGERLRHLLLPLLFCSQPCYVFTTSPVPAGIPSPSAVPCSVCMTDVEVPPFQAETVAVIVAAASLINTAATVTLNWRHNTEQCVEWSNCEAVEL